MNMFGHEISLKKNMCSHNGGAKEPSHEYINVYVRLTDHCNAACKFCGFNNNNSERVFDQFKFYYVLNELNKKIKINKVSFTGGEPGLCHKLLMDNLSIVKATNKDIFTVVNTNGLKIGDIDFSHIDSYALSRHAMGKINDKIFGCKVATDSQLSSLEQKIKDKIHLSCNLINGYVDNHPSMFDYICNYSDMGFHDYGFVSLMKVNDYSSRNHVDFTKIALEKMENTIKTDTFNNDTSCLCANYVTFSTTGDLNRWYARHYCDMTRAESILVYDVDCLRIGFGGPVILK